MCVCQKEEKEQENNQGKYVTNPKKKPTSNIDSREKELLLQRNVLLGALKGGHTTKTEKELYTYWRCVLVWACFVCVSFNPFSL